MEQEAAAGAASPTSSSNATGIVLGSASAGQLLLARRLKQMGAEGQWMPLRAFTVATLFVSAGATALVGLVSALGFNQAEDFRKLRNDVRAAVGKPRLES